MSEPVLNLAVWLQRIQLTLLLTLQAAAAGWEARQCRVVPQRVMGGTCYGNSDRDKGFSVRSSRRAWEWMSWLGR